MLVVIINLKNFNYIFLGMKCDSWLVGCSIINIPGMMRNERGLNWNLKKQLIYADAAARVVLSDS